jgi:hypothetical protein
VYDAEWRGQPVVLKLYKAGAVERHARLLGEELAAYEYRRNKAFYDAPGMRPFVAAAARVSHRRLRLGVRAGEARRQALLLLLQGRAARACPDALAASIKKIVALAHAAGLYDVDLHAGNVMVVEENGAPVPKLFDFNFIPFYVHPPNPAVWLALKLGMLDLRSRDRRKLARFHDFRRYERKLRRERATGLQRVAHAG